MKSHAKSIKIKYNQKGMAKNMAEKESWNQFATSGKVMDYLEYKGCLDGVLNATNVVPTQGTMEKAVAVEEDEIYSSTENKREKG